MITVYVRAYLVLINIRHKREVCMSQDHVLAGFTFGSYTSALSVAVPILALLGALSLTVEIISAFVG